MAPLRPDWMNTVGGVEGSCTSPSSTARRLNASNAPRAYQGGGHSIHGASCATDPAGLPHLPWHGWLGLLHSKSDNALNRVTVASPPLKLARLHARRVCRAKLPHPRRSVVSPARPLQPCLPKAPPQLTRTSPGDLQQSILPLDRIVSFNSIIMYGGKSAFRSSPWKHDVPLQLA